MVADGALMTPALKYPIRTVARMTGIGIDTLRAWERRYSAVRPARDERGRMYSEADVQRLRLLRDAVASGHAISRVARLDMASLRTIAARVADDATPPSTSRGAGVIDVDSLIDAVERFDAAMIETELARAALLLGPRSLLERLILPALREVGDRWSDGRASVAHEHMLSAIVRGVLGAMLRTHGHSETPARVVFATPSGEQHELGTLGAATLAAVGGLSAIYLGPNLPASELVTMVRGLDTDAVVLGVTAAGDTAAAVSREVRSIASGLPRDIELWLGGSASTQLATTLGPRAHTIRDYADLERQLRRLGARY